MKRLSYVFGALLAVALLSSIPARAQVTVDSAGGCHTLAGANIPCGTGLLGQPVSNGNPLNGTGTLGAWAISPTTGIEAAGATAASPILSCRNPGPNLMIVRHVAIAGANLGTAFAAGMAQAQLVVARAFTVADTGGGAVTTTTNNGKLRTSLATTTVLCRIGATGVLTAGTQTLDATPVGTVTVGMPAVAGSSMWSKAQPLFHADGGQEPLILATNEGFEILVTVPATGTWTASVDILFDEILAY